MLDIFRIFRSDIPPVPAINVIESTAIMAQAKMEEKRKFMEKPNQRGLTILVAWITFCCWLQCCCLELKQYNEEHSSQYARELSSVSSLYESEVTLLIDTFDNAVSSMEFSLPKNNEYAWSLVSIILANGLLWKWLENSKNLINSIRKLKYVKNNYFKATIGESVCGKGGSNVTMVNKSIVDYLWCLVFSNIHRLSPPYGYFTILDCIYKNFYLDMGSIYAFNDEQTMDLLYGLFKNDNIKDDLINVNVFHSISREMRLVAGIKQRQKVLKYKKDSDIIMKILKKLFRWMNGNFAKIGLCNCILPHYRRSITLDANISGEAKQVSDVMLLVSLKNKILINYEEWNLLPFAYNNTLFRDDIDDNKNDDLKRKFWTFETVPGSINSIIHLFVGTDYVILLRLFEQFENLHLFFVNRQKYCQRIYNNSKQTRVYRAYKKLNVQYYQARLRFTNNDNNDNNNNSEKNDYRFWCLFENIIMAGLHKFVSLHNNHENILKTEIIENITKCDKLKTKIFYFDILVDILQCLSKEIMGEIDCMNDNNHNNNNKKNNNNNNKNKNENNDNKNINGKKCNCIGKVCCNLYDCVMNVVDSYNDESLSDIQLIKKLFIKTLDEYIGTNAKKLCDFKKCDCVSKFIVIFRDCTPVNKSSFIKHGRCLSLEYSNWENDNLNEMSEISLPVNNDDMINNINRKDFENEDLVNEFLLKDFMKNSDYVKSERKDDSSEIGNSQLNLNSVNNVSINKYEHCNEYDNGNDTSNTGTNNNNINSSWNGNNNNMNVTDAPWPCIDDDDDDYDDDLNGKSYAWQ